MTFSVALVVLTHPSSALCAATQAEFVSALKLTLAILRQDSESEQESVQNGATAT